MRKLKKVLTNKYYSCYFYSFLLLMGYLNLQFSTNLKYHGNEEDNEELLKLVKTQKILTAGIKNLSKKCFEQNDQYNVTINGETYPKKVPLLYNTSIDFECLRQQNKDIKIILSWNDHFGLGFEKKSVPSTIVSLHLIVDYSSTLATLFFMGQTLTELKICRQKICQDQASKGGSFLHSNLP
jgi:hypothetical protein